MGREQAVNLPRRDCVWRRVRPPSPLSRASQALVLLPKDFGRLIADETGNRGEAVKFAGIEAD